MLFRLSGLAKDVWIFTISGETNFFKENIGEFQTIGIALITLLIPLGLALIQSENKDFPTLDKMTIRVHAVKPAKILLAILWIVVTPLFWGILPNNNIFNISLLLVFCLGICLILKRIKEMWDWTKYSPSLKIKTRVKFLNELVASNDFELKFSIWTEILEKKDLERYEISYFLNPFIKMMRELWKHKGDGKWNGMFATFFKFYENLGKVINGDEVLSLTDEYFFRISVELLMREYEKTPNGRYFWDEIPYSSLEKTGLEKLKTRIEELKFGSPMEQKDYEEFSSGKILDTYDRETIVYELPENKKSAWEKLFEEEILK